MALTGPILDDRSYDDLKRDLLARIPVHTPEWTDHNETDPGIVLLELFAHLGESLLFRFNQLPDATKVAFLRLLGVRPRPALAARTLLELSTEQPAGVHLSRDAEARAGSVGFQTEDEVYVWPVEVRAVGKLPAPDPDPATPAGKAELARRRDARARSDPDGQQPEPRFYTAAAVPADPDAPGAAPVDVTTTVDEALWIAVLARNPRQVAAPGGPPSELLAGLDGGIVYLGVALDETIEPSPALEQRPHADVVPSADPGTDPGPGMLWELWNGPNVRALTTLDVVGDSTRSLTGTGVVKVQLPPTLPRLDPADPGDRDWEAPPPLDEPGAAARVVAWLRVRRPAGATAAIGRIRWAGVNVVGVVQTRTAVPELLGTGTGDPRQSFTLTQRPVVPGTVQLQVEDVDGWRPWTEVETFAAADPTAEQYTLDPVAGIVTFGSRGRIPQIGRRIRVLGYRYGGGTAGNVATGAITSVAGVVGVKARNVLPASGGADPATLAEALDEVPGEVHRRDRTVTADDVAELALRVPGVRRAVPLPLLHPDKPLVESAGAVSVVVFPAEDRRDPAAPTPDVALLRRVARFLEPRRPLTCELYAVPPGYVTVAVSVSVQVRENHPVDAVRRWVEQILRQYLSPIPPFGPDGQGWSLGRAVRRAELEAVAVQVEGVSHVESDLRLSVWRPTAGGAGSWEPVTGALELERWQAPRVAAVTVVTGGQTPPDPEAGYPMSGPGADADRPPLLPTTPEVC